MRRLHPDRLDPVDPDEAYADPARVRRRDRPWMLVNMIASADGGTVVSGRSGSLGAAGDRAVFAALRRLADVVLVGAATVRAEHYHAPKKRGQRIAVVTRSGDLDFDDELFTSGAGLVVTTEEAPALPVPTVRAGRSVVDLAAAVTHLDAGVVLCEGGPTLNGQLIVAGLVDELCLTIAPTLIAGTSKRVAVDEDDTLTSMRLAHVLEEEGYLFCRYVRT